MTMMMILSIFITNLSGVIANQWPLHLFLVLAYCVFHAYHTYWVPFLIRLHILIERSGTCKGRQRKKVESNAGNKWAELHADIMDNILRKLSLSHSIKLKAVCRSWCSTVMKFYLTKEIFPWLLVTGFDDRNPGFLFFSLSEFRPFHLSKDALPDFRKYGSYSVVNDGWLRVMYNLPGDEDFVETQWFLINPITKTRIQPPPWKPSYSKKKVHVGPSLSFFSTLDNRCINASLANKLIVVTISDDTLVFCRSGDLTWTVLRNLKVIRYVDVLFCKDQLYALDESSRIWVYEFKLGWGRDSLELAMELFVLPPQDEPSFEVMAPLVLPPVDEPSYEVLMDVGLMECCGDVLLVKIQLSGIHAPTAAFRVYKLDKCLCQWVEVKNLQGDHTLFFGRGFKHSFPILSPATAVPPSASHFLRKNCIYYVCDIGSPRTKLSRGYMDGNYQLSVFNLENGTCEPCFPGGSFHRFPCRNLPWFSPNLWI